MSAGKSGLIQLVYISSASTELEDKDLLDILVLAREQNAKRGVTGMLVYHRGSFLQVLEGRPEDVAHVFAKIAGDPRHRGLIKLIEEQIPERAFEEWSMGFARPSQKDLLDALGSNDFIADAKCLERVTEGQAKVLLRSFRKHLR